MGYVDTSHGGWTELRVHGVSGTPPEGLLRHPHVRRVAGNDQAGFYRRVWESPRCSEDGPGGRVEGYCWGGLTSGDNRRALWLLLLPFMLLNVAFFMTPAKPGAGAPAERGPGAPAKRGPDAPANLGPGAPAESGPGAPATSGPGAGRGRRTDRFAGSVQRLFALSFTLTFALTISSVSMDLVGWQCGSGPAGGGTQSCAGGAGWLSWLGWDWLDTPGRQLAVTALVPVGAFLVLWRLASTTWRNLERTGMPQSTGAPDVRTPLEDRALWNGRQAVRRLRALHVTAGLAVPGVLLAAALLPSRGLGGIGDAAAWSSVASAVRTVVLLVLLVLLAGVAVGAAWPSVADRLRPLLGGDDPARRLEEDAAERRSPLRYLPWVTLGLTVLVAVAALPRSAGGASGGSLPWLVGAILGLFSVQAVLLLLLVVACALLRRLVPPRGAAAPPAPAGSVVAGGSAGETGPVVAAGGSAGETGPVVAAGGSGAGAGPVVAAGGGGARVVDHAPAWHGFAMPATALLGWLLAGGLSAGVVLRVADLLGSPVPEGQGGGAALVVPTAYHWVAVAGLTAGLLAASLAVVAWVRLRRPGAAELAKVDATYPAAGAVPLRRAEIAGQWRKAGSLTGLAQTLLGTFVAAVGVLVVAGVVLYLLLGTRLLTGAPLLVTVAGLALAAVVLGMLWVGRQAYRNPAFRRTVGIAWDLGTFWPRAVHPLAPPCYAERAIPDLIGRLDLLAHDPDGRRALLSCHSQGTVLGAAVLLQVDESVSRNTCLLTYGSPLARLYQRFFPAYFGRETLERLGGLLAPAPDAPRSTWRWRNLYRDSDPIGGPVLAEQHADPDPAADGRDVDRLLVDPAYSRERGDPCYPVTLGHSDYQDDPAFDRIATAFRDGTLPAALPLTVCPTPFDDTAQKAPAGPGGPVSAGLVVAGEPVMPSG